MSLGANRARWAVCLVRQDAMRDNDHAAAVGRQARARHRGRYTKCMGGHISRTCQLCVACPASDGDGPMDFLPLV